MLRTINTLLTIRTSTTTNLFIYYIQKLPLIGKLMKNSLYANMDLKKFIAVFVMVLVQLWGFMLRFLYLGIVVYAPVVLIGEGLSDEEQLGQFIHIFTFISFVVAGVGAATILEPKREKYVAVKLMRLSPTRYMLASLGYRYVTFLLYLLPAMLVFGTLLGASIMEAALLTVLITLWRIVVEYAHLKLFEKTGIVLIKHIAIVWTVILVGFAAAYLPLLLGKALLTKSILLNLPVCIVIMAGGLFAAIRLARYSGYRAVVDAASKRDDPLLDLSRMMADAQKSSVKTKDIDYTVNKHEQEKSKMKDGYAYLNAIFFLRHRSLIRRPVTIRLAIIGVAGVVGVVLVLLFKAQLQELKWSLETIFPLLALIMIFLSVGEHLCKAMFYNCDLSLMKYSFYRGAAYDHFRIRLGKVMSLNLLIAAALGVVLTAATAALGGEWLNSDLLMLWICVSSLAVFFTVHHLFMYYMLQPYSTELNMKNPLYFLLNTVVSSACGLSIVLRAPVVPFTITIFTATLIYFAVALTLVRKHGSRTFRVK